MEWKRTSDLQESQFVEEIAAVEHARWSHWQRYMHEQCILQEDGSLRIPSELVTRWTQQLDTPYAELSEEEKESDRELAVGYIDVFKRYMES